MPRRQQSLIASWVVFWLFSGIVFGQQGGKVTVVTPGDEQLKREAARLRMCPDTLKNGSVNSVC